MFVLLVSLLLALTRLHTSIYMQLHHSGEKMPRVTLPGWEEDDSSRESRTTTRPRGRVSRKQDLTALPASSTRPLARVQHSLQQAAASTSATAVGVGDTAGSITIPGWEDSVAREIKLGSDPAPLVCEDDVARLLQEARDAEAALEKLERKRRADEETFKQQISSEEATGERYDALLAAHIQSRDAGYNAACAACEAKKRRAELAGQLLDAERATRAKKAKEDAAEVRWRAERRAREGAAREEARLRAAFLAA
mmetsp:Transcript_18870/g.60270  ORF Transcript_18870/g.60270 Transcript_18870/m.60270 type:complete len:253 (+) Transcript_18870:44-802(+)